MSGGSIERTRIDLRRAINAISDVVQNRPRPLREFDQIHMKAGDMLLQSEMVADWADNKRLAFIGDGDAISVCVAYPQSPTHCKQPEEVHDGPRRQNCFPQAARLNPSHSRSGRGCPQKDARRSHAERGQGTPSKRVGDTEVLEPRFVVPDKLDPFAQ
jgi:hypothetical protein